MVAEAQKSSWIEGESISPRAIRAAILKQLGLIRTDRRQNPRARGIARLMVAGRSQFAAPLAPRRLCEWHKQFLGEVLAEAGRWRNQPVWIMSGWAGNKTVDYEGPPASRVEDEMARFIDWFNASAALPGPVRSGVAHLYFECIHPFEDGNGRMGRAIAEIALSQELGYAALVSLSEHHRTAPQRLLRGAQASQRSRQHGHHRMASMVDRVRSGRADPCAGAVRVRGQEKALLADLRRQRQLPPGESTDPHAP